MMCKECYSDNPRITPLMKSRECLENHIQYICSTCGRCICINQDKKRGLYRWNFPFKSLEVAKLYLKAAEVACNNSCGIYEIVGKNKRVCYKIFHNEEDLKVYLDKNRDKSCTGDKSVYESNLSNNTLVGEVRRLSKEEIDKYLKEQSEK